MIISLETFLMRAESQMVAIVVGPACNEQTKQTQSETISEIFGVESEELYCYLI